jgi:multicomponent K+:H+ antiporter subunit D
MNWVDQLVIVPVLLPVLTGAALLLVDERRHTLKAAINVISTIGLALVALTLLNYADTQTETNTPVTSVYLLGNWPAPFGIVLVLDRLSAMMLVLVAMLALATVVYSLARWDRSGPHFHTLFQFLLMGVNGAFLTGDLFNLFVFFEVMLASSYGLVLHGSGQTRIKAGMHYVVVNLAASALFLIGVAMIYGVTGTLNMADLSVRIGDVPASDRMLLDAGAGILGIAFLVKAGMWPLGFWLPTAYNAAAAPVAALFAILSKVGVYVLLRLSPLFFGVEAGASSGFGDSWLLVGGMVTIAFGAIGVMASLAKGRLAGYYILVSSGTVLAAIGIANVSATAGALYYMVSSTLAISAFFLVIELIDRVQDPSAGVLAVTLDAYGEDLEEEEAEEEVGVVIPSTLAILGLCFACCGLLMAGLPPLSGFIGKFALLTALLNPEGLTEGGGLSLSIWIFVILLVLSGLAAMISMTRAGIQAFWAPIEGVVPRVLLVEILPIAFLLSLCVALTVFGGPVMRYMDQTAQALHTPHTYIRNVMTAPRVEPAATVEPAPETAP